MMMGRVAALAAAAIAAAMLSGCGSTEAPAAAPEPEQPTSLNPQDKVPQTQARDMLVETEKYFRRGAAIDGAGDKHFLDMNRSDCVYCNGLPSCPSPLLASGVRYDPSKRNSPLPQARPSAPSGGSILSRFRKGSIKDYSYYELSRWERFCSGGWRMDSVDWKFVKSGRHPFPAELEATCKVPSRRMLRRHGFRI